MPVVVMQPGCFAQWTTTNAKYGDFYVPIHKEVKNQLEPLVHKVCTKKADALGKELSDVKAQLECLKTHFQCKPRPKTGIILPPGTNLDPNKFSPKIGKCHCPSGPGPPNSNPYISVCRHEFNGAKKHDPQLLDQHLQLEHPRLVKRVHPLKSYSAPCVIGNGPYDDHFLGDSNSAGDCGSRSGSRGGSRGGSERPQHCKMIGLYKCSPSRYGSQEKPNYNKKMHIKVLGNQRSNGNSRANDNIPDLNSQPTNDQRYNFL